MTIHYRDESFPSAHDSVQTRCQNPLIVWHPRVYIDQTLINAEQVTRRTMALLILGLWACAIFCACLGYGRAFLKLLAVEGIDGDFHQAWVSVR